VIIKGKSRSGPAALAAHLGNAEKNERVTLLETKNTVAQDLRGALIEMDAYAAGTRCEKPLYHAAISPAPPHRLTPEQRTEAVNALEERLGLHGHARVVVMHEKLGREHIHIVWSRIDLDRMRSVSDSHNYRKHEEVARDLERRFGHGRVQGAHHERDGVERPDRTPSRAELRQEERTGITGKQVKEQVTAAFRASDGPEAFKAALEERGYVLAKGDRRDFVVVDRAGGIHSLARRLDGMKATELRAFMAPLDRDALPDIAQAKEIIAERERRAREALADTALEKAYGRGEDYVSQTTAALKDHEQRQAGLDDGPRPQQPISNDEKRKDEELRRRQEAETTARQQPKDAPSAASKTTSTGNIEMTDAMQARMDRLANADSGFARTDHEPDAGPERQHEAPGGGRTRSR
jgi:Relaxase/Mobilisation nuclease domain